MNRPFGKVNKYLCLTVDFFGAAKQRGGKCIVIRFKVEPGTFCHYNKGESVLPNREVFRRWERSGVL